MTTNKTNWWVSMIAKYGSEEAVREFLRQSASKASRPGTGGFAYLKKHDPERLHKISQEAGKHGKAKNPESVKEAS